MKSLGPIMSENSEPVSVVLKDPTEARFSMRILLVMMAVGAVIASLLGPLVRLLQPDEQVRLLTAWSIWLFVAIGWTGLQAIMRREAEKQAGHILLRIPMFDENRPNASRARRGLNLLGSISLLFIMVFFFSQIVVDPPRGQFNGFLDLYANGVYGLISIWWFSRIIVSLWWRTSVWFCESGVLWDRTFLRWDHIVDAEWYALNEGLSKVMLQIKGIDQRSADTLLKIGVPEDKHEAVQSVIDTHVVQRPTVAILSPIWELGSVPLSAAIRDQRFLKFIGVLVLAVLVAFVSMHFVTSGLTGRPQFDRAALAGLVIPGFLFGWRWKKRGINAGAPRIRLRGRRTWLQLGLQVVGSATLAILLFQLGSAFGSSNDLIAYTTGFGFGSMMNLALIGLASRQIDLRENGVLTPNNYWPWSQVVAFDTTGRLVLCSGWHRFIAAVPLEQRHAVDELLMEKLQRKPSDTRSTEKAVE